MGSELLSSNFIIVTVSYKGISIFNLPYHNRVPIGNVYRYSLEAIDLSEYEITDVNTNTTTTTSQKHNRGVSF
ncbi:MAG: hypothetical protein ACTSW1_01235 [Candidatus Hodarchaeales archaeon]